MWSRQGREGHQQLLRELNEEREVQREALGIRRHDTLLDEFYKVPGVD